MDLATYAVEARKTAVFNPAYKITYPALGLVDEAAEFVEKFWGSYSDDDRIAELGDLLWYFSAVCDFAGLDLDSHFETNSTDTFSENMFILIGKIAGIAKKSVRDSNGVVDKLKLYPLLDDLAGMMNAFCDELNTTIEDVAEQNIAKLRSRQERGVIQGSGDNR
jgi:NTP pyrophosphatase (non-canonical NTP hydrolase)